MIGNLSTVFVQQVYDRFPRDGTSVLGQSLCLPGCLFERTSTRRIRQPLRRQTLTLLRERVEAAQRAGRRDATVRRARALLTEGPVRATEARGVESCQWSAPKDRSVADRVRVEAINLLEALSN